MPDSSRSKIVTEASIRARPSLAPHAVLPPFTRPFRDLYFPGVLTIAAWIGGVIWTHHLGIESIARAAWVTSVYFVVKIFIFIAAFFLLHRLGDFAFNSWTLVILKISTVAVVPDVIWLHLLVTAGSCWMILGAFASIPLVYYFLFRFLFETDWHSAGFMAAAYSIIGLGLIAMWWQLFFNLMRISG